MSTPHNRIALVTGAGSGVGRACALALLADGWRVVFSGRRLDALRESITLAGDPYGDIAQRALAAPVDVTRAESVAMLFDFMRARFGRLDLLFNSAGVAAPEAALEDLSIEGWRAVVDTRLTGALLCTQQAFRMMKSQSPKGGRNVCSGGVSAREPSARSAAAVATRQALAGLTQAASLEGRAQHIALAQIDIDLAGAAARSGAEGAAPVAAALLQMASLPLAANVAFMTIEVQPASLPA